VPLAGRKRRHDAIGETRIEKLERENRDLARRLRAIDKARGP